MTPETAASPIDVDEIGRECVYRFLSTLVTGPASVDWHTLFEAGNQNLVVEAWTWLQPESDHAAISRLISELEASSQALASQFDKVFGLLVPRECPPYETEYYPTQEPFGRSHQMADVAGFYRAFGIEPARALPERPDHLALELEFMAFLLMKSRMAATAAPDAAADEQVNVCDRAMREFFRDHLAWWVPTFAQALHRKSESGYLRAVAAVLSAWIPAECRRLEIDGLLVPFVPAAAGSPDACAPCAGCALNA